MIALASLSFVLCGLTFGLAVLISSALRRRLFARLFLGKHRTGFTAVVDALPRERWILAAGLVFVVLGGLFPDVIVARRSAEATLVERASQGLRP